MKPMPELETLLARAKALGVFGTKMRSVIKSNNARGIKEIAALFKARAVVPTLIADDGVNVPDDVTKWLSAGTAPFIDEGRLAWKGVTA